MVFFLWMLIPLACNEILSLPADVQKVQERSQQMERQVALLRSAPGPVLCESLLRCYLAGKPYIYDPFNSTSLILAGRLDAHPLVQQVEQQEYGAIQLSNHPNAEGKPMPRPERFVNEILKATGDSYQAARSDRDCTIYLPKNSAAMAAAATPVNVAEQRAKKKPATSMLARAALIGAR